jgi:hypothetical protein
MDYMGPARLRIPCAASGTRSTTPCHMGLVNTLRTHDAEQDTVFDAEDLR